MRAEVVDMSEDVVSFAEEFIGYIRSTYMNGAFGNEDDGWEWNAFERVEDGFLTNNPSEGANNRLRKRARTDHPGFYRFCDLMKEESENVKNKCQQFEQGLNVTKTNIKRLQGETIKNSAQADAGKRPNLAQKIPSHLGKDEPCPEGEPAPQGPCPWCRQSSPR